MISAELQKKIDRAIKLLQAYNDPDNPVEVAYSGGKDSDVILQLAKESGIAFRAIYRNTTIDPPGTIKHVKDNGVEILRPKKYTFRELLERKGFPSRFRRFCCQELKEYKVLDKCVMGVRQAESSSRAKRYTEPTQCRFYGNKKNHVEAIYPIRDWRDKDVIDFIIDRGIKLHPLYYKQDGTIDAKKRLGCMCCPLASKTKRLSEFMAHKGMVKFYINAGQKFLDTHPDCSAAKNHKDAYENFVHDVFYAGSRDWKDVKTSMFNNEVDYKKFLEDYFGIEL